MCTSVDLTQTSVTAPPHCLGKPFFLAKCWQFSDAWHGRSAHGRRGQAVVQRKCVPMTIGPVYAQTIGRFWGRNLVRTTVFSTKSGSDIASGSACGSSDASHPWRYARSISAVRKIDSQCALCSSALFGSRARVHQLTAESRASLLPSVPRVGRTEPTSSSGVQDYHLCTR